VQQTVQALKAHVASRQYGEDVSSLLADVPEWCVLRVETWANAAGMETYREEERDDGLPIVFGGKVLVLDINFYVAREPPTVQATSVKTSYASAVGATTIASNSVSLAGLIRDALNAFFHVALMDEDERDVLRVAQLAKRVQEHLAYLMRLDHLALAEGSTGLRWFTALDDLALQLEISASERAREVSRWVLRRALYSLSDMYTVAWAPQKLPSTCFSTARTDCLSPTSSLHPSLSWSTSLLWRTCLLFAPHLRPMLLRINRCRV
jgi:hypothetical protein